MTSKTRSRMRLVGLTEFIAPCGSMETTAPRQVRGILAPPPSSCTLPSISSCRARPCSGGPRGQRDDRAQRGLAAAGLAGQPEHLALGSIWTETSSTADHILVAGVVDAADVLGVDAVPTISAPVPAEIGVFDQCRTRADPAAVTTGPAFDRILDLVPSRRRPSCGFPATPQPRVEHLVQARLQQQQRERRSASASRSAGRTPTRRRCGPSPRRSPSRA